MLKRNLIANYLGQGWSALMALAFIPVYLRFLGVEGYGLIGFFSLLQAFFVLVDSGLSVAINREVARCRAGEAASAAFPRVFGRFEWIYAGVAGFLAAAIFLAADAIGQRWLRTGHIAPEVASAAIGWMGLALGLLVMESLYRAVLAGAQRQVALNVFAASFATLRAAGAVAVLAWLSVGVTGYFVWQAIASLCAILGFAIAARRVLGGQPPVYRIPSGYLPAIARFAAGSIGGVGLALLLTQLDKLLLSRLLELKDFGYYTLAATVAAVIYQFVKPIAQAYYPRLSELVAADDTRALAHAYHRGAQLCAATTLPVAMLLAFFGDRLLLLWTGDPLIARQTAPLLTLLALGTALNGMMNLPYLLQLAHGWTRLSVQINGMALLLLLPALLWLVPRYGAVAGAACWVTLNVGYIAIAAPVMHRRLLPAERNRWWLGDVLLPIAATASVAGAWRWIRPDPLTGVGDLFWMLGGLLLSGVAALAVMPALTAALIDLLKVGRARPTGAAS